MAVALEAVDEHVRLVAVQLECPVLDQGRRQGVPGRGLRGVLLHDWAGDGEEQEGEGDWRTPRPTLRRRGHLSPDGAVRRKIPSDNDTR